MSQINELYQDIILDHNRRPRNFGPLPAANHRATGNNPLCGDRVTIAVRTVGDRIEQIGFEGAGCAISTASASMMTEALSGKTLAEARQLFDRFHELLTSGGAEGNDELGSLIAFAGVREFPMRVKCATLAWHALRAALAQDETEAGGNS